MLKFEIIPVTAYQQNCSLIWCDQTKEAALVDPGGDVPVLMEAIKKHDLNLTQIWLTHGHLDHVGGTEEIATSTGAKIIGPHQDDYVTL